MGLVFKIVEEPIAAFQSEELVWYDALERRTHERIMDGTFWYSGDEQIDVIHRTVQQFETFHDLLIMSVVTVPLYQTNALSGTYRSWNNVEQVVKVSGGWQTAQGAIRVVSGDSVISSALEVQRNQIHAERLSRFLEQVVRQLLNKNEPVGGIQIQLVNQLTV